MKQASRHRYEYDVTSDSAQQKVISFAGREKRVLELGSGPGSITKHLASNLCRVTALEVDDKAIELVRQHSEAVFKTDLNNSRWPELLPDIGIFDVVIAADVLEHLYDPLQTLTKSAAFLAPSGRLIVSLPHIGHAAVVACLLAGDFEYRAWGLLDSTHVRFFGIKNIQSLFDAAGLSITDVSFITKYPQQTELYTHWQTLGLSLRRQILKQRFSTVYQVVICATKSSSGNKGVEITKLRPPRPQSLTIGQFMRSSKLGESILGQIPSSLYTAIKRRTRSRK